MNIGKYMLKKSNKENHKWNHKTYHKEFHTDIYIWSGPTKTLLELSPLEAHTKMPGIAGRKIQRRQIFLNVLFHLVL